MSPKEKKSFINLTTIKALIAVLVLSAGTIRTFMLEARQNEYMILGMGVVVVFFCLSAIADKMFAKK